MNSMASKSMSFRDTMNWFDMSFWIYSRNFCCEPMLPPRRHAIATSRASSLMALFYSKAMRLHKSLITPSFISIYCFSIISFSNLLQSSWSQVLAGVVLDLFSISITFLMTLRQIILRFGSISVSISLTVISDWMSSLTSSVLVPLKAFSVLFLICMM